MRTYKRKTQRGKTSKELLQVAADAVLKDGKKLKTVARELEICHMTLHRFVKKVKAGDPLEVGYKPRNVFSPDQERIMVDYLLKCAAIYFGLLPEEVKKLAYSCATKYNLPNIPSSWHRNEMAGADWFTGFLKRNSSLSIRTPEATSAGRASAFNRHNVNEFFGKLGDIMMRHNLPPSRIWNLDETGVTTVLKPKKIVAQKGSKQVGAIVSAERGTLVTVELAVSAAGNSIPPMFVFPRLKYKDIFLRDGPPESIGAGNSSGWMTAKEFLLFMDHFIKFTKPTQEEPVLLLLDNHSSHIDIEVVEKAKANFVIMLSFPPHCTHHLQPLDVGVNGPFKTYCAKAQDNWLRNNPGKTMSIYEIPGIVRSALPLAATPVNIMNSFKKTGIGPFDPNVFTDADFAPSFVTDRPAPENNSAEATTQRPGEQEDPEISQLEAPVQEDLVPRDLMQEPVLTPATEPENESSTIQPGPSRVDVEPTEPKLVISNFQIEIERCESSASFSPEIIKPYPKAGPRLATTVKRRIRKSAILTDTPEKNALAMEQAAKKRKTQKTKKTKDQERVKGACAMKGEGKRKYKNKAKRRVLQEEESENEDEECFCIICCDAYSNSRPNESWIQCSSCKQWAHVKCIDDDPRTLSYICPNCSSEGDEDSD